MKMKLSEYKLLMLIIEAKIKAKTSTTYISRGTQYDNAQDLENDFIKKYIEKENNDG
jgi:hypothetical protein